MRTIFKATPFALPSHFDRLVNELFNAPAGDCQCPAPVNGIAAGNAPLALDISEDDTSFFVRASVPGFRKEDIQISVHEGVLAIEASRTEVAEETKERFLRRERLTGSLSRKVSLPAPVVESGTTAELENGILTLTLPKVRKEEPRKISIK
ncbi:MAG: Hsp20/alpha crystallin family protein [Phycisphaerales bacterium]|nr:Hsp20/alpha crystallin family protein [Phycisphaerales bacterium]